RAFHVTLSFHIGKIDIVGLMRCKKTGEIARGWKQRQFAAQKLECLSQIVHAVDVDLADQRGFKSVCFRNEERLFATTPRFQRYRKHAFDWTNTAIERELANKTEFLERGSV